MTNEELQGRYQLGFSYEEEGNLVAAEKQYDMIIADPSAQPSIRYKAYKAKLFLNHANTEVRNNLMAVMTDIFSKEEELIEQMYFDLAFFFKGVGDPDRMINNLEQLTVRFPNGEHMTDALLELGLAYHHIQNNLGKAIQAYTDYFNRVKKKHPGIQIGAVNLAECYNKVGQTAEAKALLKRYIKIG